MEEVESGYDQLFEELLEKHEKKVDEEIIQKCEEQNPDYSEQALYNEVKRRLTDLDISTYDHVIEWEDKQNFKLKERHTSPFKNDILQTFDQLSRKKYKKNPVSNYVRNEFPRLLKEHKEKAKDSQEKSRYRKDIPLMEKGEEPDNVKNILNQVALHQVIERKRKEIWDRYFPQAKDEMEESKNSVNENTSEEDGEIQKTESSKKQPKNVDNSTQKKETKGPTAVQAILTLLYITDEYDFFGDPEYKKKVEFLHFMTGISKGKLKKKYGEIRKNNGVPHDDEWYNVRDLSKVQKIFQRIGNQKLVDAVQSKIYEVKDKYK